MKSADNRFGRRDFLKTAGLALPWLASAPGALALATNEVLTRTAPVPRSGEWSADLIILGGGLGGCAAALAAARHGLNVIVTEETDWIGGQLTQQAVPPDENKWIETFGGTRSYQQLRTGIREYYRRNYPLTEKARALRFLNPGNSLGHAHRRRTPGGAGGALRAARALSRQWSNYHFAPAQGRGGRDHRRQRRSRDRPRFGIGTRNYFAGAVVCRCDRAGGFAAADEHRICHRGRGPQSETGEPHAKNRGRAGQSAGLHDVVL